jgi:predicted Zn-dependent protease
MVTGSWLKRAVRRTALGLAMASVGCGLWSGAWTVPPAAAQQRREPLQFIRDAEIENIIRGFARPLFAAAAIDADSVDIVLVRDPSLNAFVAGGMNIFIHTGLLADADDASQLIGVIAHETGHIAGGHLIRGHEAMENASAEALLAMLLGVGAAVASGQPGAGAAIITGGTEMARRSVLAFSRAQEASADAAGLSYMEQAGLSARGLGAFLQKLAGQELLPADRQAAYTRTHPLTRDRIDTIQAHLARSRYSAAPVPPQITAQFERMKAKLIGFINPQLALRRYRAEDRAIAARYGRAVALYQEGEIKAALPAIDSLIAEEPRNPYFQELKGQVLLENRRIVDSLPFYRRSVELLPDSGLLRAALAQALLETNTPALIDEALKHLEAARHQEKNSPFVWRLFATAWGRKGQDGLVAYALAEEALARGDRAMARHQADRAERMLPPGSPGWLRAQDIRGAAGERR